MFVLPASCGMAAGWGLCRSLRAPVVVVVVVVVVPSSDGKIKTAEWFLIGFLMDSFSCWLLQHCQVHLKSKQSNHFDYFWLKFWIDLLIYFWIFSPYSFSFSFWPLQHCQIHLKSKQQNHFHSFWLDFWLINWYFFEFFSAIFSFLFFLTVTALPG